MALPRLKRLESPETIRLPSATLGACGANLCVDFFVAHWFDTRIVQVLERLHQLESGLTAYGVFQQLLDGTVGQQTLTTTTLRFICSKNSSSNLSGKEKQLSGG